MNAAEAYSDAEEFRIALNACVQAIRNVTFVLQKHKSNISNFPEWYGMWQEALKTDPIMVWCVEARNKIVKEGDLKTESLAIASLVDSYNDAPVNMFRVNPFLTGNEIADLIKTKYLPDELTKYGYLKVERQWIVESLPKLELLSLLAHAFTVLHALVYDIENQQGPKAIYRKKIIGEDKFRAALDSIDDEDKPGCMLSFQEYRTTWLKLSTDELAAITKIKTDVVPINEAKQHYGLEFLKPKKTKDSLRSQVEYFLRIGKRILETDGFHPPTIVMLDERGRGYIFQAQIRDNEDKYLFWNEMAKEVQRKRGVKLIIVSDTWYATLDPKEPSRRPSDSPDRQEALQAVGVTQEGEEVCIVAQYIRQNDKINFKSEETLVGQSLNFLAPIQRIWENKTK